jgi:predicted TIM-barrel fold metal-dependent hydrolase
MIIDFHCHILPPSFPSRHVELTARDATYASLFPQAGGKMATAESLLEAMDGAGITRAVVMGFGWEKEAVAREANDYLIQAVKQRPERLVGFCSVNPAWGKDRVQAEIERCAGSGLKGIGELHPDYQGFDITDWAEMAPMMESAQEIGLPVLIHTSEPVGHQYPGKGRTTPDLVYRLIRNFPDNIIVCAHWGGGLPFYGLMPEVPAELANVYFDTAASPFLYKPDIFDVVSKIIGIDKVLFATDFPLIQYGRLIRQVEQSCLDPSSKAAVLGGNAAKLLGLEEGQNLTPAQDEGCEEAV